ncbi:MAG: hypothetical protein QXF82_00850 [Nitrososphaeria archaeon]
MEKEYYQRLKKAGFSESLIEELLEFPEMVDEVIQMKNDVLEHITEYLFNKRLESFVLNAPANVTDEELYNQAIEYKKGIRKSVFKKLKDIGSLNRLENLYTGLKEKYPIEEEFETEIEEKIPEDIQEEWEKLQEEKVIKEEIEREKEIVKEIEKEIAREQQEIALKQQELAIHKEIIAEKEALVIDLDKVIGKVFKMVKDFLAKLFK